MAYENAHAFATVASWATETTTKGTAESADAFLHLPRITIDPVDTTIDHPIQKGFAAESQGEAQPIERGTNLTIDAPLTFEQIIHLISISMEKPAVGQPTTPGGTNPRLWTFDRDNSVIPDPWSATLRTRRSSANVDIDDDFLFMMAEEFTITGSRNESMRMGARCFSRRRKTGTFAAGTSISDANYAGFQASSIATADTWAALIARTGGNYTVHEGDINSINFTLRTGIMPYTSAQARTDLDFGHEIFNHTGAGFTFTFNSLLNTDATPGLYGKLQAAAEATGQVFIALHVLGSNIETTFDREVNVYMAARMESGSLLPSAPVEGVEAFDATLRTYPDATGGTFLRIEVQNDVDAADVDLI